MALTSDNRNSRHRRLRSDVIASVEFTDRIDSRSALT